MTTWESYRLPQEAAILQRKRLHRVLRKVFPSFPRTPMPHGRLMCYLWELFPEECLLRGGATGWKRAVRQHMRWYVLPEDPEWPAYLLESSLCGQLPVGDFYYLPEFEDSMVLCCDHEGIGPWQIPSSRRLPLRETQSRHSTITVQDAEKALAKAVGSNGRYGTLSTSWIKKALRKGGVRIPTYPLPTEGYGRDWIWNYLPWQLEVGCGRGSFLEALITRTPEVEAIVDGSSYAYLWSAPTLRQILTVPDAYFVESPLRRWLVAVPSPFVQHGANHSPVSVSFVILR